MVSQGHLRQLATGLRAELQQLESLQLIDPRGLRHMAQWTQPLLILAKSLAFGKLLIQPSRLATPRAFAPRLVVRTRDGVAGDLCTQRLADMLRSAYLFSEHCNRIESEDVVRMCSLQDRLQ